MRNEHGEIVIGLAIFLFVIGVMLGGFFLTKDLPCDDKVQHCIHYGSGAGDVFEDPNGLKKN